MKNLFLVINVGAACLFVLLGCSGEYVYRKDIEQLSKPGTLDRRLTGIYDTYKFKFLDKYQISHQWLRNSNGCSYMGLSTVNPKEAMVNGDAYAIKDIFEANGSTWQRSYYPKDINQLNPYNFDRFVRAEYLSGPNGNGVFRTEKGFEPICFQSWWTTSNYIRLRLQKRPLNELIKAFTERYTEGIWTIKKINNLTWHVQETSEDKFRPRPINGVGGPFQTWVLPLADTGYTMAIELGASKESLQYPDAHARMQAMFKHIIESVSIEPIANSGISNGGVPSTPQTTSDQPSTQINRINPDSSQVTPKASSTSIREYPSKTQQLQQNIQNDSNRDMKNLLRNTAPKTNRFSTPY